MSETTDTLSADVDVDGDSTDDVQATEPARTTRRRTRATRNQEAADANRRMYDVWQKAEQQLADATASGNDRQIRIASTRVDRAKADLLESNRPLLGRFLGKYRSQIADENAELELRALEAMWHAITTWDPDKGLLSGWIYIYVHSVATDMINKEHHPSLSDRAFEARPKIRAVVEQLEEDFQQVTVERVVAETGLSESHVRQVLEEPRHVSYDRKLTHDDGSATIGEMVEDTSMYDAAASFDRFSDAEGLLSRALEPLNAVERFVVMRRNGLDSAPPWRVIEIASVLGLGRQSIMRAEQAACRKSPLVAYLSGKGLVSTSGGKSALKSFDDATDGDKAKATVLEQLKGLPHEDLLLLANR